MARTIILSLANWRYPPLELYRTSKKKAGVSQPMVAHLEKGDSSRTPTFETVFKVLKALGYTLSINVQKEKKPRVA
jgi:predicted transcriptional regulator